MNRPQQLGFVTAVLALGVAVGRFSAPEAQFEEDRFVASARTVAPASLVSQVPAQPTHARPRVEVPGAEIEVEEPSARTALPAIDSAFAAAQSAARAPDDPELACAAREASHALGEVLLSDPYALTAALARFRQEQDVVSLEVLSAELARVVDPAVEELALELAQRDPDPARRAVAFDLLDRLDAPAAVPAALAALDREGDPQVRRAALRAIPGPRGAELAEAGPVVAELTRLLASDADPEVRRRAAILLGEWRTCDADLVPILEALIRDPSAQVRAGCAFACELAGRRSERIVDALVAALQTAQEDPLVRDNAWHALGALAPLPARAHAAWTLHGERRDAAGEAVD